MCQFHYCWICVRDFREGRSFYALPICDQSYSGYFDQNCPHKHQFNAEKVFTFEFSYIKLPNKFEYFHFTMQETRLCSN